jgi:hypothetical protein
MPPPPPAVTPAFGHAGSCDIAPSYIVHKGAIHVSLIPSFDSFFLLGIRRIVLVT